MLGKLVAYGPNREAASRRLLDALDGTAIFGLTTNLGFLRGWWRRTFRPGRAIYTSWFDGHAAGWGRRIGKSPHGGGIVLDQQARQWGHTDAFGPDGWRPGGRPAPMRLALATDEERHELALYDGWADEQAGLWSCTACPARRSRLRRRSKGQP